MRVAVEKCREPWSANAGLNYTVRDKTFSTDGILERTRLPRNEDSELRKF